MALPDAPQTRGEQYLNAIANGQTSGLPTAPQTRMEQYLDYIAKNGGGGGGGGIVHAVVDVEDIFSEEGASFSLDMSMDEFLSGGYSAISLDLNFSGTVFQSFIVPLTIAFPSYGQVIFGGLCGIESLYFVLATLADAGGGTVTGQALAREGAAIYYEPFVVTCTPTAADMSGTMDKTPEEIKEAYDAGREIKMRFVVGASNYVEAVPSIEIGEDYIYAYFVFVYLANGTTPVLVNAYTNSNNDATYAVNMYALTPVSGS